jgi:hypothetical protein
VDTLEYEVEFKDGATDTYTANIIAESMYSQVNEDGNSYYSLLSEIVDHKSDGMAVRKDDGFVVVESPRYLEGQIDFMGAFKGPEEIVSGASGGIRCGKQNSGRTCFCLVGKACVMKM